MCHPHPNPIDAATLPSALLAEYVRDSSRNTTIQRALDFVNVTDTKLETLFLRGKDRLISRSILDGKLVHPPAVIRRTTKVIRELMSQTARKMIIKYCDNTDGVSEDDYQGMLDIFDKVDRLVDICNARGAGEITKSKTPRNTHKIDHPKHQHLTELFDVLRLFEEWKNEAGGFNKHFITKQTYEDLQWTVYGIAGVAVENLEEDRSKKFDQGISGSDCCEHFFTGIKQDQSNPTLGQANQAADKRTALNAISGGNQFKSKRGGSNHIDVAVDPKEYFAPIVRPSKKRKSNK
jgi:hypothetical protein